MKSERIAQGKALAKHHHHHHIDPSAGDARIIGAVVVNLGLTIAQIIGGVLSGSLALLADALHNFSDAISLIIAFLARKIARRPADEAMTFGYGRAEVVAALVNYTTLIIVGLYLIYEAVLRFFDPQGVDGWLVVIIAGIALAVDTVTALLTFSMSKDSVNIRAAFLHNVADALGSIAVIFAGTLILLFDWRLVDPIVTLIIAAYILCQSFAEIRPVIRILMLGSPPGMSIPDILTDVRSIEGVADIHHVHLWQMQEHETALNAHLVISQGAWGNADMIKISTKNLLQNKFGISHATLEIECSIHACPAARIVGHETTIQADKHHHHADHEHT